MEKTTLRGTSSQIKTFLWILFFLLLLRSFFRRVIKNIFSRKKLYGEKTISGYSLSSCCYTSSLKNNQELIFKQETLQEENNSKDISGYSRSSLAAAFFLSGNNKEQFFKKGTIQEENYSKDIFGYSLSSCCYVFSLII